jgi:hypothetical protein
VLVLGFKIGKKDGAGKTERAAAAPGRIKNNEAGWFEMTGLQIDVEY